MTTFAGSDLGFKRTSVWRGVVDTRLEAIAGRCTGGARSLEKAGFVSGPMLRWPALAAWACDSLHGRAAGGEVAKS
jgi:hypothetical protein